MRPHCLDLRNAFAPLISLRAGVASEPPGSGALEGTIATRAGYISMAGQGARPEQADRLHEMMMDDRRKGLGMAVAGGAVLLAVIMALIGLATVYAGAYNVAATEEHTALVRWAFATTFRNSIQRQAADIQPPGVVSPEMMRAGATGYKQMCEHCHAGPGVDRAEWASGMRPKPPRLKDAADRWKAQEIFWLVKHGAKMSGMPAFGPTHDDQALWNIVAFVKELPAMTPETYAALGDASSQSGHSTPAIQNGRTKR